MYLDLAALQEIFSSVPDEKVMEYGISEPFSWRGSYDEVAFSIEKGVTSKQCKERIETALTETFYGHKGGDFQYQLDTLVNFECERSSYSDGEYTDRWLEELEVQEEPSLKLAKCLASRSGGGE